MNLSRRSMAAAVTAACFAIAACHHDDAAGNGKPQTVDAPTLQHAQDALSQPAWLHDHLPATTVAYLRLPSPWGLIGAVPDGRALDQVTASDANLKTIAALREAIAKDSLLADSGGAAYVLPLLVDLRSPVEAVASDPIGVMSPGTQVLLSMRLAQHTPAEVATRFAALGPAMRLAREFDANGDGRLAMGAPVHFDAASQRLFVLAGRRPANNAQLSTLLASIAKPQTGTPVVQAIAAQERAIDASGEGLFGWASLHGVGSLATGAIPQQTVGTLPGDLLGKADGIAFGAGSVGGHGSLQLRLHAPQSRLLGYLAPTQFDPSFKVAGEPRWVAHVALPGAQQLAAFETNLALDFGAGRAAAWRRSLAKWKASAGFELADLARWVGPELIGFEDDAGSYAALRVRDRKALYAQIERLAKVRGWRFAERSIDGARIHALTITHTGAPQQSANMPQAMRAWTQLAARMGSHFYWVEDGDFLIFAKVPQALADRVAAQPSMPLDTWLRGRGYPGADSLLGVTAVTRDAQRNTYYAYLQILQIVNDLSGGGVDLMAMPAAHTLRLPHQGLAGLSLGVTDSGVSFRVNYEQQPLELLGASGNGSGMTAVAVVAIVAAIAIPAYQDYVLRSEVAEGLVLAGEAKVAVAEYHARHGRWPTSNAAAGLPAAASIHGKYVDSVTVTDQGAIRVHYGSAPPSKAHARIANKNLELDPQAHKGTIAWSCHSDDLPPNALPTRCRQP